MPHDTVGQGDRLVKPRDVGQCAQGLLWPGRVLDQEHVDTRGEELLADVEHRLGGCGRRETAPFRQRAGAGEAPDEQLTYSSTEEAIALAARGKGSLVGSLVTADPVIARQIVRGLAPWHGRILVLDSVAAPDNTGHGTPMPTLVHGGPGRAGGGEELGGLRGVVHHMQRSAIQGSPAMLDAITG